MVRHFNEDSNFTVGINLKRRLVSFERFSYGNKENHEFLIEERVSITYLLNLAN